MRYIAVSRKLMVNSGLRSARSYTQRESLAFKEYLLVLLVHFVCSMHIFANAEGLSLLPGELGRGEEEKRCKLFRIRFAYLSLSNESGARRRGSGEDGFLRLPRTRARL